MWGKEGEGEPARHAPHFSQPRWKDAIHYSLVLDGAGADTIVAEALGSRRFESDRARSRRTLLERFRRS